MITQDTTPIIAQIDQFPTQRTPADLPFEASWYGCYSGECSKDPMLYTAQSIRHPAKMSLKLLRRIIAELLDFGLLKIGNTLVDPFGGRGATALEWCALHPANQAVTCELEKPFVDMQRECWLLAKEKLGYYPLWTRVWGDSRRLHEALAGDFSLMREAQDRWMERQWQADDSAGSFQPLGTWGDGQPGYARLHLNMAYPSLTPCDRFSMSATAAIASPPYGKGVIGSCTPAQLERLKRLTQDPTSSLYGRDPEGEWFKAMAAGYQPTEGNIDLLPDDEDYKTLAVSSPPYAGVEVRQYAGTFGKAWEEGKHAREVLADVHGDGKDRRYYGDTPGQIGTMPDDVEEALAAITSPPYFDGTASDDRPNKRTLQYQEKYGRRFWGSDVAAYGSTPGQIAQMRDGKEDEALKALAAITSPPYENSLAGDDPDKRGGLFRDPKRRNDPSLTANYLSVTSPPYEAQSGGHPIAKEGPLSDPRLHERHAASKINSATGYAENSDGQIGTKQGESYASACRDVYRSLWFGKVEYAVLVTKNPVKDGEFRRLDLLTIKLMADAGYELIARRRAWLWETRGQMKARGVEPPAVETCTPRRQALYKGREDDIPVGRISFFNEIHMGKGRRAPAQWEDVLFFRRVS